MNATPPRGGGCILPALPKEGKLPSIKDRSTSQPPMGAPVAFNLPQPQNTHPPPVVSPVTPAGLKQGHRPHFQPGIAPRAAALDFGIIRRNGRSSQQKLPSLIRMINTIADGIPEHWRLLPFVNQPWRRTIQKFRRTNLHHEQIVIPPLRLVKVDDALRRMLAGRRSSTPFDSLYKNGSSRLCSTSNQIV